MGRKYLTTRPKHLTTLDLVIGDEILYRDENYFSELKSSGRPNPSLIKLPELLNNEDISDSESSSSSKSAEGILFIDLNVLVDCDLQAL